MGKLIDYTKKAVSSTIKGTKWLKNEITAKYCTKCGKRMPPETRHKWCYECWKKYYPQNDKRRH